MAGRIFICLFSVAMLLSFGCDVPQPNQGGDHSDIQGLKLGDLQARDYEQTESLLSFSILSYVLDVNSLDVMEGVMRLLSDGDVRYDNAEAFEANGFVVGVGQHRQGSQIAQKLQAVGAIRLSQSSLSLPAGAEEPFYSFDIQEPKSIIYSTSQTGLGGMMLERGRMGWVISAQTNVSARGLTHVTLGPAFWRRGIRDLRMLEGKEPFQYRMFDMGRFHLELEPGEFFLLGTNQIVPGQDMLNRLLFEIPERNKVRLFVIIFGGRQN